MAFPNRRGRAGAPRGRFALGEGVATPRARVEGVAHGSDCARGRSRIHMQTMHTRTLTLGRGAKWLIAALSALLACLTVAASASAATSTGTVTVSGTAPSSSGTTLTNTFLTSYAAATVTGGICDPQGTSTVSFEIDGTASAPYAGTFHETGTVTIGPQTGINGRGEITDFRSSFSINSSTGTVHGTKTGGLSQYNYAICTPGTAGSVVSSQIIASALTYEASITKPDGGTFNDSGTTWDNFNAYSGAQRTNTQYEFRSNFSSQVPVTPDTQAPKLTLPATITKEATSAAGVVVDYTVGATDNVDSNPKVACLPVSGSTFPVGTTTVNCTATDAAGNKSAGSFDAVVPAQPDIEPPAIKVPETITATATSASGATVDYTVTGTDAKDGTVAVTCEPASGSTFPVGTTTVNCTATDAAGNKSAGSFDVVVAPQPDTAPPAIKVPDTITKPASSPSGEKVDYEVSATDAKDGTVAVTCDPASGSTFPVGRTTVACTSKDAAGNTATASFDVVVDEPLDSDGDGLWDVIEIWLGCNPHKADTDGDGINDRIEILLGTNPTKSDSDPSDDQADDGSYLVKIYGHLCGCGPDDDP